MVEHANERSTIAMMTAPDKNGSPMLPKRAGARTLLPSTWISRDVRVGYVGINGEGVETSAVLLDWCGHGPVLNLSGEKTVLSWDCLRSVTLVDD